MTSPYGVVVYDDLGNRVYYAGGGTSGGSLKVKPAPHVTRTGLLHG